jgi:hypothetical protein|tara:strand:- start:312 stop:758 length:447 start_codon:yes stop_codon:yes gene_type:complete
MNKKDKLKYIKPRLYHKVIKDIEKTIQKIISDPRSIDRSFWTDHIKFSDTILKERSIQRDDDEMSVSMVEGSSIYLISQLILQVTLFHRVLREGPDEVIMYPKNHIPYYVRQTDSKGRDRDFWDLHSLELMRSFYDKEDKTLNEWMKD